jgi:hypothetical protein
MEKHQKQPKQKSAGKPRDDARQGDVVNPGTRAHSPGGPGADIRRPQPAPGTTRDPLVHPGDHPDIQQDVIGQSQPRPARQGDPAERPDSQQVGGQGNAKP